MIHAAARSRTTPSFSDQPERTTMLIDTGDAIVNTAYIVSVASTEAEDGHSLVRLSNGGTVKVRDAEPFKQACGVIVPAQPGFALVTARLPTGSDEESVVYVEEPVIAFRVTTGPNEHDGPMPIVASGEPGDAGGLMWTVRQPGSLCFGPWGRHTDLDDFKAYCERAAEQRRRVG